MCLNFDFFPSNSRKMSTVFILFYTFSSITSGVNLGSSLNFWVKSFWNKKAKMEISRKKQKKKEKERSEKLTSWSISILCLCKPLGVLIQSITMLSPRQVCAIAIYLSRHLFKQEEIPVPDTRQKQPWYINWHLLSVHTREGPGRMYHGSWILAVCPRGV